MAALLSGIPYYTTRSNSLSSVKFLTNYYFYGMGMGIIVWGEFPMHEQCGRDSRSVSPGNGESVGVLGWSFLHPLGDCQDFVQAFQKVGEVKARAMVVTFAANCFAVFAVPYQVGVGNKNRFTQGADFFSGVVVCKEAYHCCTSLSQYFFSHCQHDSPAGHFVSLSTHFGQITIAPSSNVLAFGYIFLNIDARVVTGWDTDQSSTAFISLAENSFVKRAGISLHGLSIYRGHSAQLL